MLPFLQCHWWSLQNHDITSSKFTFPTGSDYSVATRQLWGDSDLSEELKLCTLLLLPFFIFSDICRGNKFYSDFLVKNVLRRRMQEAGAQFFGYDIICGNSAEPLNNLQIRVHAFATPAISVSQPASKTANMQKTSGRRRTVSWKSKSSGRWPTDM